MKISKLSILILVLMVGITGCKKKEDEEVPVIPEETGAIFVTVAYGGQAVSGATVTTDPETSEVTTNAMGNVLIQDVSEGIYQVFATKDGFGSGSGAVDVGPGEVSEEVIYLVPGVFEGLAVNIVSVYPQNAVVGESVSITAVVNDDEDEDEQISFEWSTDMDGVISTEGTDMNGFAEIEYIFETAGERTLTVTVTDTDGNTDVDSTTFNIVEPPEPVVLAPIEVVDNAMHLTWSQTEEDGFISYRVYREGQFGFTLIEQIYDIGTNSFIDTDVDIGMEYNYQIGLYLGGGTEIMSNIETGLFDGEYIDIGTGLDMLLRDPENAMIYGLDTDNNSLLFIDTEQEEVVNTIYVGSAPTDMDFGPDDGLLYIANSGSTEITKVDVASQVVQSSVFVDLGNWSSNPHTLAVISDGRVAVAGDGSSRIKMNLLVNGSNLYTTGQSLYNPFLITNSDGTVLYAGESGTSLSELYLYDPQGMSLILQENSSDHSVQSPLVFITENDEFIYHGARKYLASSLSSIVGTFDDNIYAINSDGSRAIGETEVYNGFNFSTVQLLPLSTKVSVFGNDDTTAWLFHEQTTRLYKVIVD